MAKLCAHCGEEIREMDAYTTQRRKFYHSRCWVNAPCEVIVTAVKICLLHRVVWIGGEKGVDLKRRFGIQTGTNRLENIFDTAEAVFHASYPDVEYSHADCGCGELISESHFLALPRVQMVCPKCQGQIRHFSRFASRSSKEEGWECIACGYVGGYHLVW